MTARDKATQDIREDLMHQNKCFIAFKSELNPIMRRLVREQLREQNKLPHYSRPNRSNSRLIAHCCFIAASNTATLSNYQKYYGSNK